ncbi:hypothetical protein D3C87_2056440 [compost metagenome]
MKNIISVKLYQKLYKTITGQADQQTIIPEREDVVSKPEKNLITKARRLKYKTKRKKI